MKEMRVKCEYDRHDTIKGAIGVKLFCPDLENALAFYNLNKSIFTAEETKYSVSTNIDKERKNKYTLTTDDKYKVIFRIDSTVLYVDAPKESKNDVKKIIKKLGY